MPGDIEEDTKAYLEAVQAREPDPAACLRQYPDLFRNSLAHGNRMCLCSFMAAEYDDLPAAVKQEVQAFADINVAWLEPILAASGLVAAGQIAHRARAIFAAIAGAQLLARSRADIALYDTLIASYRPGRPATGLIAARKPNSFRCRQNCLEPAQELLPTVTRAPETHDPDPP